MKDVAESQQNRSVLDISNITQYTAFMIVVGLTYTIIRLYLYYVILLHIPIFQYIDTADMILSFPTAVFLILYAGPIFAANKISQSELFNKGEKLFYIPMLWAFVIFLFIVAKRNEPIVAQYYSLPLKYWAYGIIPFIIFICVVVSGVLKGNSFFKHNVYVAIILFALWYGIFESFANYEILTTNVKRIHFSMKLKDGQIIRTSDEVVYAGRTKNYWFIFSPKKHLVRAIKNANIEIMDYDVDLK